MHQQERQPGLMEGTKRSLNGLVWFCQMWAKPLQAFMAREGTPGERYHDGQTAAGLVWVFIFAVIVASQRQTYDGLLWLYGFVPATVVVLLIHKIARVRLRAKGWRCHSRLIGLPWLPGSDPVRVWRNGVPVVLFVAAALFATVSIPLALYLAGGAVCHIVSVEYMHLAQEAEVRAAEDARHDAEWLSGRLRGGG